MNIEWTFVPAEVTGPVRWIAQTTGDPVLAMIRVASRDPSIPFRFESGLIRIAIGAGEIPGGEALATAAGPETTAQSLPSPPNWDMTSDKKTARLAVERFGGATTAIAVHDGKKDIVLSPPELESYTLPRLVRATAGQMPNALTTISIDNTLLYFDLGAPQLNGRRLGKALSGQLWQTQQSQVVLLNEPADKSVSRLGENPGRLLMEARGNLFTPAKGVALGEGRLTYQFDCAIAGDNAYLLLVTDHGPGLGVISLSGSTPPSYSWFRIAGSVASSPSVIVGNGSIWLALVEYEDLNPIGVRIGSLPVS